MKILIADDHTIVRKGLLELLRYEYPNASMHEASNGGEVIEKCFKNDFDLILLDISMPGRNGIDTLMQLRADGIKCPVLILSMQPEEQYGIRVLKAGASGFVNKETATEQLIFAVRRVMNGKKYISDVIAEKLAEQTSPGGIRLPHELLSNREMEVLKLLASGKTISDIAASINLSVNTISTYRSRILEKLGLHNNAELTRYAIDNNLS